jgi:hypothetical protein
MVFNSVHKLHGLPEKIVSDRDSLSTSLFWKRLNELLNVELWLLSTYHLQTDGATERANRTMIWDNRPDYPGVDEFASKMKEALMKAHDTIIEARVKQTDQANKHRWKVDFSPNELVYLSTKNLQLPKGWACKLVPKYIGPFKIEWEVMKGVLYQLEPSKELKARGIHDVFHLSLL